MKDLEKIEIVSPIFKKWRNSAININVQKEKVYLSSSLHNCQGYLKFINYKPISINRTK